MKHYRICAGDQVEVRNAYDTWVPATATTEVEDKVIWVAVPGAAHPVPWPAEDVRPGG